MTCLRWAAAGYFCTIQSTVLRQRELIDMRKLRRTGLIAFHQSKEFCQTRLKVEWD